MYLSMINKYLFRFAPCIMLVLTGMVSGGCGSGSTRVEVSGTVTMDGLPMSEGTILFVPLNEHGIRVGSPIKDGNYEVPAEKGPQRGEHRVEITWERPTGKILPSKDIEIQRQEIVQMVPAKYNKDSTLKVNIEGSTNSFDFDLESK